MNIYILAHGLWRTYYSNRKRYNCCITCIVWKITEIMLHVLQKCSKFHCCLNSHNWISRSVCLRTWAQIFKRLILPFPHTRLCTSPLRMVLHELKCAAVSNKQMPWTIYALTIGYQNYTYGRRCRRPKFKRDLHKDGPQDYVTLTWCMLF